MNECFYKKLKVSPDASFDEIKKSYRRLAQQYHPDKNNGNNSLFLEISAAYKVLSSPEKRRLYDLKHNQKAFFTLKEKPVQDKSNFKDEIKSSETFFIPQNTLIKVALNVKDIFINDSVLIDVKFSRSVMFVEPTYGKRSVLTQSYQAKIKIPSNLDLTKSYIFLKDIYGEVVFTWVVFNNFGWSWRHASQIFIKNILVTKKNLKDGFVSDYAPNGELINYPLPKVLSPNGNLVNFPSLYRNSDFSFKINWFVIEGFSFHIDLYRKLCMIRSKFKNMF